MSYIFCLPKKLLFYFHKLDGFAAGAFDHDGARVAELIRFGLQEFDILALELDDPGIEIGNAETDVIVELAAGGSERLLALIDVPVERNVVEENACARGAIHAVLSERGEALIGRARDFAIGFGVLRSAAASGGARVQMFLIPELSAEGIVLVHVDVVESLDRHVALVFDDGVVGTIE